MSTQPRFARARALPWTVAIFGMFVAFSGPADAQRKDRTGKEVVDAVCGSCHATGKDNSPRIGDAKAWSARATQGLTALTAHALSGIRKMPAHGGPARVSDLEIRRAIAYMVNQSGGHWVEPANTAMSNVPRSPESIVQGGCAKCHQEGKDGAPRLGDRAAWTPRLARGLDTLVASAVHGHGPMPSRGGMPELSTEEVRESIVYMFNFGLPPPPPVEAAAPPNPFRKVLASTEVNFGMIRAEAAKDGIGKADVPSGKGYQYLSISLVDSGSRKPLTEAQVTMRVSDGMSMQNKELAPVTANNAVSWGGFFRFDSGNVYNIVADIRRPGVVGNIEARFDYRAP